MVNNRNLEYEQQVEPPQAIADSALTKAARERFARKVKPNRQGNYPKSQLTMIADIIEGKCDHTPGFRAALAEEFLSRQVDPDDKCMVNHELQDDLFLALLDRQRETVAMLRCAIPLLKEARAEEFLAEVDEFLRRVDASMMKELLPSEEPF